MTITKLAKVSYSFVGLIKKNDSPQFKSAIQTSIDYAKKYLHAEKLQDYYDGDTYVFTRSDRRKFKQINITITDKNGKSVTRPVFGTDCDWGPAFNNFVEGIMCHLYVKSQVPAWMKGNWTEMFLEHVFKKNKN